MRSGTLKAALRSGSWLTGRTIVAVSLAMLAVEAVVFAGCLRGGLVGSDFAFFYAVSEAARTGRLALLRAPLELVPLVEHALGRSLHGYTTRGSTLP